MRSIVIIALLLLLPAPASASPESVLGKFAGLLEAASAGMGYKCPERRCAEQDW